MLQLLRCIFPKRPGNELLLIFQLVLMILFAMAVLSPIDTYSNDLRDVKQVYPKDHDQIVFFNPTNAAIYMDESESAAIYKAVASDERVEKTIRTAYDTVCYSYTDADGTPASRSINLILYEKEFFASAFDAHSTGALISPSLVGLMPVGTEVSLQSEKSDSINRCTIAGVLPPNAFLPNAVHFGSYPELGNLGVCLGSTVDMAFIAAPYDSETFGAVPWEIGFTAFIREGVNISELLAEWNLKHELLGTFCTLDEIKQQALEYTIVSNRVYVLLFLLLTLIAIFGYGGYLFLSIYKQQKSFAIYYILGMTRRKMILLNCCKNILLLLLSLGIAQIVSPWFQTSVLQMEHRPMGTVSSIYCIGLFGMILVFSMMSAFYQTKKAAAIAIYKGGD